MSDIRQDWDDYYGTCCIEYCHICHNAYNDLWECPDCRFLFCLTHKYHDCISKHYKKKEESNVRSVS